jgi:hypothetical protein
MHVPGGIRTHDPSKRSAADLRLRPSGHWDRQREICNSNCPLFNVPQKVSACYVCVPEIWQVVKPQHSVWPQYQSGAVVFVASATLKWSCAWCVGPTWLEVCPIRTPRAAVAKSSLRYSNVTLFVRYRSAACNFTNQYIFWNTRLCLPCTEDIHAFCGCRFCQPLSLFIRSNCESCWRTVRSQLSGLRIIRAWL